MVRLLTGLESGNDIRFLFSYSFASSLPVSRPLMAAVVGKIHSAGRDGAEVLPGPRLAPELGCCWQDARRWQDCSPGAAASTRDSGSATCGNCVRFAADRLTGLKLRWLEDPLTIATPPFDHTGVVALTRSGEEFRNCYRVPTASPPMAFSQQQNRWKCGRFIPVLTVSWRRAAHQPKAGRLSIPAPAMMPSSPPGPAWKRRRPV